MVRASSRRARAAIAVVVASLMAPVWSASATGFVQAGARPYAIAAPRTIVGGTVTGPNSATGYFQLPFAMSVPAPDGGRGPRVLLLSYETTSDSSSVAEGIAAWRSVDGGDTWTQLSTPVPFITAARWADGEIDTVGDRTTSLTATTFTTGRFTSVDAGATWTTSTSTVTMATPMTSLLIHRGTVVLADGSVLATAYGREATANRFSSWLIRSSDRGRTWRSVGRIAATANGVFGEGYDEPSLVQAADGSLLVALRQWAPIDASTCAGQYRARPVVLTRSTDGGRTWTTPVPLTIPGGDWRLAASADPQLSVLADGRLMLALGRPTARALVSADNGRTWSRPATLTIGRTSGYASAVLTGYNRYTVISDYGSNWCFAAGVAGQRAGIWQQGVEVPPSGTGAGHNRIDLRTALSAGTATLHTDLTGALSPASGPMAAVDGNVEPDAGAVGQSTAGSYLLDLGTPQPLTGIALSLPLASTSATVSASTDNLRFTRVAALSSPAVAGTLVRRTFATTWARYVQITLTRASAPVALGSVELDSLRSTFEDDPLGYPPLRSVATPFGTDDVTVIAQGHDSQRSVQLNDATQRPALSFPTPTSTTRTLDTWVDPTLTGQATLTLSGHTASGAVRVITVVIGADGSVETTSGSEVLPAGSVPAGTWTHLVVRATASGATVSVDAGVAAPVPGTSGTASFGAAAFSFRGAAGTGGTLAIDDLLVGP